MTTKNRLDILPSFSLLPLASLSSLYPVALSYPSSLSIEELRFFSEGSLWRVMPIVHQNKAQHHAELFGNFFSFNFLRVETVGPRLSLEFCCHFLIFLRGYYGSTFGSRIMVKITFETFFFFTIRLHAKKI